MTITIREPARLEGKHCEFEEYDKDSKMMRQCRKPATALAGRKFVCAEHMMYVYSLYHEVKPEGGCVLMPRAAKDALMKAGGFFGKAKE